MTLLRNLLRVAAWHAGFRERGLSEERMAAISLYSSYREDS